MQQPDSPSAPGSASPAFQDVCAGLSWTAEMAEFTYSDNDLFQEDLDLFIQVQKVTAAFFILSQIQNLGASLGRGRKYSIRG